MTDTKLSAFTSISALVATDVVAVVRSADTANYKATMTQVAAFGAFTGMFGTGADGALSISAGTTTLAKDMHYTNLTLSGTLCAGHAGHIGGWRGCHCGEWHKRHIGYDFGYRRRCAE